MITISRISLKLNKFLRDWGENIALFIMSLVPLGKIIMALSKPLIKLALPDIVVTLLFSLQRLSLHNPMDFSLSPSTPAKLRDTSAAPTRRQLRRDPLSLSLFVVLLLLRRPQPTRTTTNHRTAAAAAGDNPRQQQIRSTATSESQLWLRWATGQTTVHQQCYCLSPEANQI